MRYRNYDDWKLATPWDDQDERDDYDPEQDFNGDESSLDQAADDARSYSEAMEAFLDGRS